MQKYTDLDLEFMAHPGTGDITRVFNLDAIKGSIRNIVQGRPFEKPFDEFYGADVNSILFSLYSPITKVLIKKIFKEKLELYEPRIIVDDVIINYDTDSINITNTDSNRISIDLHYTVKSFGAQILRLEMERIR